MADAAGGALHPGARASDFSPRAATGASSSRATAAASDGGAGLLPSVALPEGGGAIRGIGEKFSVNAATGTASLSVPIPIPAGRGGLAPRLTLGYDSGAGNGPFGFGWSLGLPAITRKTDKGLPRYLDDAASDVFILAGADDLVPIPHASGTVPTRTVHGTTYEIHRYRPRVEGLFARIERWTAPDPAKSHWRTISRDNLTSLYGLDSSSRIEDPGRPEGERVFTWLIARSFDDKGNVTAYEYAKEDARGVDAAQAHEANRDPAARTAQRYLKRVLYGNVAPWFADYAPAGDEQSPPDSYHFEIVFDYGDHAGDTPTPAADQPWLVRPDPFSSYRASFEVRTYRRCQRILVFHHFDKEDKVWNDCLTRAVSFEYSDEVKPADPLNPIYTFVHSVTETGYRRVDASSYVWRSMPPLELDYSTPALSAVVQTLDPASAANLPEGIDGSRYQWVDVDGEGLSGILYEDSGAWRYKRNVSPLTETTLTDGTRVTRAAFAAAETLTAVPAGAALASDTRLLDLSGDGQLDVVSFAPGAPGFFERTPDSAWAPYRPFPSLPRIDWNEPNLRMVDLTGDGLADALLTEDGRFTFWQSAGERGFDTAAVLHAPTDERRGPRLVFADGEGAVFLADMTGDGLSDLVRVRDGEVCYWPNLGYGRFGGRVTMDASPRFADHERYDPRRVRLADMDGSGTSDLLYVGDSGVYVCFNRSGNAWSGVQQLAVFPGADTVSSVQVLDLMGTGTACLVWSTPLPGTPRSALRYVDLMGGTKPHLLTLVCNNLGSETRLTYAPSTRFYVKDRADGRPWVTRLPFPVHVVERVESYDMVGRSRFVNRYAYHHGYFDGLEREFRGFGMVEQRDTEEHRGDTSFPEYPSYPDATNWDSTSWSPPVLTRTWFHTGAFIDASVVSKQYASEYWIEPGLRGPGHDAHRAAMELSDSLLPGGIAADELREAYRALKGMVLRTEVFAEDGSPHAGNPYTVAEQNYEVRRLQPRGDNRYAVFLAVPREKLTFAYERQADDPRVLHELMLEVGDAGEVKRSVSVAYGRRAMPTGVGQGLSSGFKTTLTHDQTRLRAVGVENTYTTPDLTDAVLYPDVHRTPLLAEQRTAELVDIAPQPALPGRTKIFGFAELDGVWSTIWNSAHDAKPEEVAAADVDGIARTPAPARRVISRIRTRYRKDDLTALLDPGVLEPGALPGERYTLAFAGDMAVRVVGVEADRTTLLEGGYIQIDGDWWIPSGRMYYSAGDADTFSVELAQAKAHFYAPRRAVDPFGNVARVKQDDYDLLAIESIDAAGNTTHAKNDYRVLKPSLVTDPNGNRRQAAYDALGLVTLAAVMGKAADPASDAIGSLNPDPDVSDVLAHFASPLADPKSMLGTATTRMLYDVHAYHRTAADPQPSPVAVYTIARELHVADAPGGDTRYHHMFVYADGFGREIQRKARVEADPGTPRNARWIGSGWTIFDNKENVVRKYEPFFSNTHAFEFANAVGVSTVSLRDPLGRVVATLQPDRSWTKARFEAWAQKSWDANDTCALAPAGGTPDPRNDPDVGDYFTRLLGGAAVSFESWYDRRIAKSVGGTAQERDDAASAAAKTAACVDTFSEVHVDALGRPCLHVADAGPDGLVATRTLLDNGDRPLVVTDALGRAAMEYCRREPQSGGSVLFLRGYDLAGHLLYRNGMDGGARRFLPDVAGEPIRSWDARGQAFTIWFDALRRHTHRYVSASGGAPVLLERIVYGEGRSGDNLCGRLWRRYDASGLTENTRYDADDNLVASTRQLAKAYRTSTDWTPLATLTAASQLDAAAQPLLDPLNLYTAATTFDALRHPIQTVLPHGNEVLPSVLRSRYDDGGSLQAVDLWLRQPAAPAALLDAASADVHVVTDIVYDPRGQRSSVSCGNGVSSAYDYDAETFRLRHLTTTRPASYTEAARVVQKLTYTYDAAGNVTTIRDDADTQNVVFFRNRRVEPSSDYTYDPLYRLISATGREQLGRTSGALDAPVQVGNDDGDRLLRDQSGDGNALGTYTETYDYDVVGNLLSVLHQVATGQWTRAYRYAEQSAVDATQTSNRLSATSRPGDGAGTYGDTYSYDAHGNMTGMPHLSRMSWDEDDWLRATSMQRVNAGTPETTCYVHGADGERVRKVTDAAATAGVMPRAKCERVYLGSIELYREFDSTGAVTLERETVHVDAGGQRAALVETRTVGGGPAAAPQTLVRYQHGNLLGSAVLELDAAGDVISYEEYFPYGSTSYQAVRADVEVAKRYRYTGKERDDESGLYYHGARYYAPWLGLWTSCDPRGLRDLGARERPLQQPGAEAPGSRERRARDSAEPRYQYVKDNPVRMTDPDGRTEKDHVWKSETGTIYVIERFDASDRALRLDDETRENFKEAVKKASNPDRAETHLDRDLTTSKVKGTLGKAAPGDAVILIGHSKEDRENNYRATGMKTDDWFPWQPDQITGKEISESARDTPPSLLVLAGCRTSDLAAEVKGSGARVVLGVMGEPGPATLEKAIAAMVKALAAGTDEEGSTIAEAMAKANEILGKDMWHPATIILLDGDPKDLNKTLHQLREAGPAPDSRKQPENQPATTP